MVHRHRLGVEDEPTRRRIVVEALERSGYEVSSAGDGEEGLHLFESHCADLVVADIMMPRMDGFEMVRRMRTLKSDTLFLFLSARSSAEDVVEGFRTGGHDYLRKPFAMSELLVRIEALLSRLGKTESRATEHRIGEFTFDIVHSTLCNGETTVRLSSREAAILDSLAANMGRVVSSRAILIELWGDDSYYNLRSLNVYISKLRGYLSADSRIEIVSVRGVGYKLLEE